MKYGWGSGVQAAPSIHSKSDDLIRGIGIPIVCANILTEETRMTDKRNDQITVPSPPAVNSESSGAATIHDNVVLMWTGFEPLL